MSALSGRDAAAFAQRALVSGLVLGLVHVRHGVTVAVGDIADLGSERSADATTDLVVMIDGGRVPDAELGAVLAEVRARIGDGGAIALVLASPVTGALVRAARELGGGDPNGVARAIGARDDAYARAMLWAAGRARAETPTAPAMTPERLALLVEHASAVGLTLVEDVTTADSHGLSSIRGLRSPRARALLATLSLGSATWPMMFVPTRRAPKGALARAKRERLAGTWVSAGAGPATTNDSTESDLVHAALAVLDDAAASGRGPLPFKDLLRESRERWSSQARARGGRATPGTADAAALAEALYRFAADETVVLHAFDPSKPGWVLTIARPVTP